MRATALIILLSLGLAPAAASAQDAAEDISREAIDRQEVLGHDHHRCFRANAAKAATMKTSQTPIPFAVCEGPLHCLTSDSVTRLDIRARHQLTLRIQQFLILEPLDRPTRRTGTQTPRGQRTTTAMTRIAAVA